jgi:type IV pilus assembly protein PilB
MSTGRRIGELLVAAGLITEGQLGEALAAQASTGRRLGEVLVGTGHVREAELTQILSNQLSVAWVSLELVEFTRELLSLLPGELALKLGVLPVHFRLGKKREKILYVAMNDPTDIPAMQEVSRITGMHVRPLIAPPSELNRVIREQYFPRG